MKTANPAAPGKTKEGEPEQNELQMKPTCIFERRRIGYDGNKEIERLCN